jgi:hypothetical protein
MTSGECTRIREDVPEFALGVLGGAARAEVVEHTAHCVECRALVADLARTADSLVWLAPEVEPPRSFTHHTVARIGTGRRRPRARRAVQVAAVTAAALAIGVGGFLLGRGLMGSGGSDRPDAERADAGRAELAVEPMRSADGTYAGRIYLYRSDEPWAVVSVDYGTVAAGRYSVVARLGGAQETLGSLTVDDRGRGAWGGALPEADLGAVSVVDGRGAVLCAVELDGPQSIDPAAA